MPLVLYKACSVQPNRNAVSRYIIYTNGSICLTFRRSVHPNTVEIKPYPVNKFHTFITLFSDNVPLRLIVVMYVSCSNYEYMTSKKLFQPIIKEMVTVIYLHGKNTASFE
jgi:hypothetical protein